MMKVYVLKDTVVGKFHTNQLTMMHNDKEAERALKQMAANIKESDVAAPDLQLWCIGVFDENTGLITDNAPYLLGNLIDYVEVKSS